jgi:hypothetical protein
VLFETLDLFRETAREVASATGLPYDPAADGHISGFLSELRDGSGSAQRGTDQAVGRMFWFIRKRLPGSHSVLSSTRRR